MMKIKIKVRDRRFIIPVPYAFLHLSIGILTSKRILVLVNRAIEKKAKKKFQIPDINRNDLKPLLTELSKQRGLLLLETSLKDGTEVSIRL
ncbi:hypothetical protein [Neobacillus sp. PS2-9]|jgi:hypothetical protein|uniref:hypothetical protein n=1 Tax=Neobacillus sp. PS2-9 TaxID=3070676 RepID=UPI0027E1CA3F|nr:hypothetical protein [Neobacillus sp. PS2-9]WML58695.1 hypothetical protein RCG25_02560 [Neobacillus sp. PS2-9]